jgi:hypothetical protein
VIGRHHVRSSRRAMQPSGLGGTSESQVRRWWTERGARAAREHVTRFRTLAISNSKQKRRSIPAARSRTCDPHIRSHVPMFGCFGMRDTPELPRYAPATMIRSSADETPHVRVRRPGAVHAERAAQGTYIQDATPYQAWHYTPVSRRVRPRRTCPPSFSPHLRSAGSCTEAYTPAETSW